MGFPCSPPVVLSVPCKTLCCALREVLAACWRLHHLHFFFKFPLIFYFTPLHCFIIWLLLCRPHRDQLAFKCETLACPPETTQEAPLVLSDLTPNAKYKGSIFNSKAIAEQRLCFDVVCHQETHLFWFTRCSDAALI